MSTWAIGDIQGCFASFEALLSAIDFRPKKDRVWLVGDLVNRGPKSAEVLRWCREHDSRVVAVLGNHDLHLLAHAEGVRKPASSDTLQSVLDAPDRKKLLKWLRRRPLLHRESDWVLVHAGIPPRWGLERAVARARKAEEFLLEQGAGPLVVTGGDGPQKLRETVARLTHTRLVNAQGDPVFDHKGPPETAPRWQVPWYAHKTMQGMKQRVVFGHWAALGLRRTKRILALDTGAVWGNYLTAVRLEDGVTVQQPAVE